MNFHKLFSDQSYMWSVRNDRANHFSSQATPQAIAAQAATTGCHPSGLSGRTLQALRQSQLQMRTRSRAWAEVLPFSELPGKVAADGLHPPGRLRAGQRARSQLRPGSRDLGGDLRDQPRTTASARAPLRCGGEPGSAPVAHHSHRSPRRRDAARQHACQHARRGPAAHALHGGQQ